MQGATREKNCTLPASSIKFNPMLTRSCDTINNYVYNKCEMASDKTSLIDGSIYSDDDNDSTAVTRTASENIDAPKKHQTRMQFSGNELVVAVFVTAFDMKKG